MTDVERTEEGEDTQDIVDLCKTEKNFQEEEKLGGPCFVPRLYLQRYSFVQQTLTKLKAKQIVDFGSAECRIARFLSHIPTATEISLIDIDRIVLEQSKWCIRPMTYDYVIRREKPLTMRIFEGSVTQFDSRLKDYDTVTMVEVIEHLHPKVLEAAVTNVFGNIIPRVVVLTTPNADFNVLFPNFTGFRHWDHKFEWTQAEFRSWCDDIAGSYNYTVDYSGIGDPPEESRHVGSCSQAAIFTRLCPRKPSLMEGTSVDFYSLIAKSSYPYKTSEEANEDSKLCEINFILHQFQTDSQYEDYDCNCLVPLNRLLGFKKIKMEFTEEKLRDYLRNHGYRLSEDGETIILPAIHKYSDTDVGDEDSYSDTDSKELGLAAEGVQGDDSKTTNNEVEFWD